MLFIRIKHYPFDGTLGYVSKKAPWNRVGEVGSYLTPTVKKKAKKDPQQNSCLGKEFKLMASNENFQN